MLTEVLGIINNGSIHLDEALPFPDQTRVRLIIESVATDATSSTAWERIQQRLQQRPIHGEGQRFHREDLHERR